MAASWQARQKFDVVLKRPNLQLSVINLQPPYPARNTPSNRSMKWSTSPLLNTSGGRIFRTFARGPEDDINTRA